LPLDEEIQFLLTTKILPKELFVVPQIKNKSQSKRNNIPKAHPSLPLELYAIKTCGDGDCLLHAISLGLWGREDTNRYLRGLLSLALSSEKFCHDLLSYWCEEELQRDISLGFSAARDLQEIQNEFHLTAGIAHEPGRYLEGIHIASLANILRRPIICYSQDVSGGDNQSSEECRTGQSLSGIYLPIMHQPKDCCHVPLVIVYTMLGQTHHQEEGDGQEEKGSFQSSYHVGHFSAIIGVDPSSHNSTKYTGTSVNNDSSFEWESFREEVTEEETEGGGICFPLVDREYRVLPLRYCYPYQPEMTATRATSARNPEKRNALYFSYFDIENISLSSLEGPGSPIPRTVPIATTKRGSVVSKRGGASSKFLSPNSSSLYAGSVVYRSKINFYSNVLDSKQSELLALKAKMKEIEVTALLRLSLSLSLPQPF
jgi:hypothetical protein